MEMPTKKKTPLALLFAVLLLGGVAMWLAMPRNEPTVGDANATQRANAGDVAATAANAAIESRPLAARDATPSSRDATPSPTNEVREAASTEEQAVLRVVVRGIRPDVPWTTPLHLEYVGLYDTGGAVHHDDVVPDAEGRAQFVLPPWWKRCRHGRITAENGHYRSSAHHWMSTPEVGTVAVIDVRVIAELRGRVVDANGMAVGSTVTAFPIGVGSRIPVATTSTERDGTWVLQVPPGQPLLLVARTAWLDEDLQYSSRLGKTPNPPMLLPASRRATCPAGAVVEVPALELPAAMPLHCSVLWSDGTPIAKTWVRLMPRDGDKLEIMPGAYVQIRGDGRLATTASAQTDANGEAVLPMLADAEAEVRLSNLVGMVCLSANVVRPVHGTSIEFRVPRPVTVRATANGAPVPEAMLESSLWDHPVDTRRGTLALAPVGPLRLRAVHETRCSPWFELSSVDAGKTIDLEVAEARQPVTLVLEGASLGANIDFEWSANDGRAGRGQMYWEPGDRPMRLFLEPGQYRLRVRSNAPWKLLPAETRFVVASEPVTVALPANYGGLLVVDAKDDSGTNVEGTCRVRSVNGDDATDRFWMERDLSVEPELLQRSGAPGELLPGGLNRLARVLEPGEYELVFVFPTFGERRERMTVRAGEVATVTVRL